jgi:Cu-processing system ATP-binding protein
MTAVINFTDVSKRYGGKDVLQNIDLHIAEGEYMMVLGHNGAGKTTLIKLVLGLTKPSGGEVRVLGENPAQASARLRSHLGYLPENVSLYPNLSGREALNFYARLKGEPLSACDILLERLGLLSAAERRISTYSKGMRQRLGLAQALLGRPRLLFLDEPTSGLDPALRRDFYDLLGDLKREGVTVFLSSHALTEIESRGDRLIILRQGRIVARGTIDELRHATGLPVRLRLYLSPAPDQSAQIDQIIGALGPKVTLGKTNGQTLDLSCFPADKMEVVRHIVQFDALLENLDIDPPGLEEIYKHFSGGAQPQ